MSALTSTIFVILVIVLGIGGIWIITAHGASTPAIKDSYGNTADANTIHQNNESGSLAIATMPLAMMPFIIVICIVLVIAVAWLWRTGTTKGKKY
jgi:hypothetical protein